MAKGKCNLMKIQTLVSTMNKEDISFLEAMNLKTDVVVGNQNNRQSLKKYCIANKNIIFIESNSKGLSNNRNLTLSYADADICIIADDDIVYCDNYDVLVQEAFENHSDADIIIFNVYEKPTERYVIKKAHRVRGLEFLKYGSVRIALRRSSIINDVVFDERFGAGGRIPSGEDTIFLADCLKKKKVIYAVPDYILYLPKTESSWFKGYDNTYFINKGKMYYRIFGNIAFGVCILDVLKHKSQYAECGNIYCVLKLMKQGISEFSKHN